MPKLAISCQLNSSETAFKNCQKRKLFFARSCQNQQFLGSPIVTKIGLVGSIPYLKTNIFEALIAT